MTFWMGVALGATAMYLFDPQHGRRRREVARETYERLRPAVTAQVEAAAPAVRDLGERAREAAGRVPVPPFLKGASDGARPDSRPAIMDNLSETQIAELTRQFEEQDRQGWDALTASYGWTSAESHEVWGWFERRPEPARSATPLG